jgi:hypothetical protein
MADVTRDLDQDIQKERGKKKQEKDEMKSHLHSIRFVKYAKEVPNFVHAD